MTAQIEGLAREISSLGICDGEEWGQDGEEWGQMTACFKKHYRAIAK